MLTLKSFHCSSFASCCYGKHIKQENMFEILGCISPFSYTGAHTFIPEKFHQGKVEINMENGKKGESSGRKLTEI